MGWNGLIRTIVAIQQHLIEEAEYQQRVGIHSADTTPHLAHLPQRIARLREQTARNRQTTPAPSGIHRVVALHHYASEPIDWLYAANEPEPTNTYPLPYHPLRLSEQEDTAQRALEAYEPSTMERLWGKDKAQREVLVAAVEAGRVRDEQRYDTLFQKYQDDLKTIERLRAEWQERLAFAGRVLEGEIETWYAILEALEVTGKLRDYGDKSTLTLNADCVYVSLLAYNEAQFPLEEAPSAPTPRTRAHTLYRDYSASAAIRVARELLALLPVPQVVVTILIPTRDPQMGQALEMPVLSAHFTRAVVDMIEWAYVEPAEALKNFPHRLNFRRVQGLQAIAPIVVGESAVEIPVQEESAE